MSAEWVLILAAVSFAVSVVFLVGHACYCAGFNAGWCSRHDEMIVSARAAKWAAENSVR